MFEYDAATGELRWKVRSGSCAGGTVAGTIRKGRCDYLAVGIRRKYYLAHRIIWKWMTGEEPESFIDHIDGDKRNNRWANLREADTSRNKWNERLRRDNISGVKGVCWDAGHKKWRAVITANKKSVRLGRFDSVAEAAKVVEAARAQMHGDFARFS